MIGRVLADREEDGLAQWAERGQHGRGIGGHGPSSKVSTTSWPQEIVALKCSKPNPARRWCRFHGPRHAKRIWISAQAAGGGGGAGPIAVCRYMPAP
jgi:hypothetical protein